MTSLDFTIIMPEILLAGFALLALLAGAYFGKDRLAAGLFSATVAAFGAVLLCRDRPARRRHGVLRHVHL